MGCSSQVAETILPDPHQAKNCFRLTNDVVGSARFWRSLDAAGAKLRRFAQRPAPRVAWTTLPSSMSYDILRSVYGTGWHPAEEFETDGDRMSHSSSIKPLFKRASLGPAVVTDTLLVGTDGSVTACEQWPYKRVMLMDKEIWTYLIC